MKLALAAGFRVMTGEQTLPQRHKEYFKSLEEAKFNSPAHRAGSWPTQQTSPERAILIRKIYFALSGLIVLFAADLGLSPQAIEFRLFEAFQTPSEWR